MGSDCINSWSLLIFLPWNIRKKHSLWLVRHSGCGVLFEDHLQAKDPFLARLYWFHVCYTTRHLLEELHITLPGDKSHSWYQNGYDARAYKRLCSESSVSPDTAGGRRWIVDVKASDHGSHTWHHLTNIGMHIKHKMVYPSTQWTQSGINATFQRPGQHSFLTNQTVLRKRVWHDLMTQSALLFGQSWNRKL